MTHSSLSPNVPDEGRLAPAPSAADAALATVREVTHDIVQVVRDTASQVTDTWSVLPVVRALLPELDRMFVERAALAAEVAALRARAEAAEERVRELEAQLGSREAGWTAERTALETEVSREHERAEMLAEDLVRRQHDLALLEARERRVREQMAAVAARAHADREETLRLAREMVQSAEEARFAVVEESEALRAALAAEQARLVQIQQERARATQGAAERDAELASARQIVEQLEASRAATAAELARARTTLVQTESELLAAQHEYQLAQVQIDKLCSAQNDMVEDRAQLVAKLHDAREREARLRLRITGLEEKIHAACGGAVPEPTAEPTDDATSALAVELSRAEERARGLEDECAKAKAAGSAATIRVTALQEQTRALEADRAAALAEAAALRRELAALRAAAPAAGRPPIAEPDATAQTASTTEPPPAPETALAPAPTADPAPEPDPVEAAATAELAPRPDPAEAAAMPEPAPVEASEAPAMADPPPDPTQATEAAVEEMLATEPPAACAAVAEADPAPEPFAETAAAAPVLDVPPAELAAVAEPDPGADEPLPQPAMDLAAETATHGSEVAIDTGTVDAPDEPADPEDEAPRAYGEVALAPEARLADEPEPDARPAEPSPATVVVVDATDGWRGVAAVVAPDEGASERLQASGADVCVVNLAAPGALACVAALRAAGVAVPLVGCAVVADAGVSIGRFDVVKRPVDPEAVRTQLGGAANAGASVIMVGSDSSMQIPLRQGLLQAGMSVRTAWDRKQAAALADATRPDVVVVDLASEAAGGADLVLELARRTPAPLIVLVAGAPQHSEAFVAELAAHAAAGGTSRADVLAAATTATAG